MLHAHSDHVERAKAIVSQAVAEAETRHDGRTLIELWMVVYGAIDLDEAERAINRAMQGTAAEGASLRLEKGGRRYVCWNCCGLAFEGEGGVCPNCEQEAQALPESVMFSLRRIRVAEG
ncbi:MAG: hypothetical protein GYB68_03480 [Chloroflexi bacterium]|nr:hypothetical protein [Chloroflexota bacterium]